MLCNIPHPQPNQSIPSLAALAAIYNGISSANAATRLFGVTSASGIRNPFHHGTKILFRELGGAGYDSCQGFLDGHGLVRYFQPFVPESLYQRACDKLIGDNSHGIASVLGTDGISPFATEWRYCQCCMTEQFEAFGYAYPLRSHQVQAMGTCATHSTPLVTILSVPEYVITMWGLVVSTSQPDFENGWVFGQSPIAEFDSTINMLSPWIEAAFTGGLRHTTSKMRIQIIRDTLGSSLGLMHAHKALPSKLDSLVRSNYSNEYLKLAGLPLSDGGTAHWPAMLAGASMFVDHPMANLLILSLLFDSPAQFNEVAGEISAHYTNEQSPHAKGRGVPKINWSLSLLKDVLRLTSLSEVAQKNGISIDALQMRLDNNPGLQRRRKDHLKKRLTSKYRRILEEALAEHSDLRRAQFRTEHGPTYSWLIRYDRTWFLKMLPPYGQWAEQHQDQLSYANQPDQDRRMTQLIIATARVLKANTVPTRLTQNRLLLGWSVKDKRYLSSGIYPETQRTLDGLIESVSTFLERIRGYLDELISQDDIPAAKQWATHLLKQFPHRTDVVADIVDKLTSIKSTPIESETSGSSYLWTKDQQIKSRDSSAYA